MKLYSIFTGMYNILLCWLGITSLNVVLWKYIPVWLVHYGVNTQATTIAEPELPGERKSTTQIPRVMDKATEQRIDMEEVTWNFNVHATQLRFTRKPWSRRLRLIASRIPCAKYPLRTPVICFFAGVAFFKTQQWAHFGLQRVASLGASEKLAVHSND